MPDIHRDEPRRASSALRQIDDSPGGWCGFIHRRSGATSGWGWSMRSTTGCARGAPPARRQSASACRRSPTRCATRRSNGSPRASAFAAARLRRDRHDRTGPDLRRTHRDRRADAGRPLRAAPWRRRPTFAADRDPHARARRRRQHGDVQHRQRRAAAAAAVSARRSARHRVGRNVGISARVDVLPGIRGDPDRAASSTRSACLLAAERQPHRRATNRSAWSARLRPARFSMCSG